MLFFISVKESRNIIKDRGAGRFPLLTSCLNLKTEGWKCIAPAAKNQRPVLKELLFGDLCNYNLTLFIWAKLDITVYKEAVAEVPVSCETRQHEASIRTKTMRFIACSISVLFSPILKMVYLNISALWGPLTILNRINRV